MKIIVVLIPIMIFTLIGYRMGLIGGYADVDKNYEWDEEGKELKYYVNYYYWERADIIFSRHINDITSAQADSFITQTDSICRLMH